jgi:hypothetical protein
MTTLLYMAMILQIVHLIYLCNIIRAKHIALIVLEVELLHEYNS